MKLNILIAVIATLASVVIAAPILRLSPTSEPQTIVDPNCPEARARANEAAGSAGSKAILPSVVQVKSNTTDTSAYFDTMRILLENAENAKKEANRIVVRPATNGEVAKPIIPNNPDISIETKINANDRVKAAVIEAKNSRDRWVAAAAAVKSAEVSKRSDKGDSPDTTNALAIAQQNEVEARMNNHQAIIKLKTAQQLAAYDIFQNVKDKTQTTNEYNAFAYYDKEVALAYNDALPFFIQLVQNNMGAKAAIYNSDKIEENRVAWEKAKEELSAWTAKNAEVQNLLAVYQVQQNSGTVSTNTASIFTSSSGSRSSSVTEDSTTSAASVKSSAKSHTITTSKRFIAIISIAASASILII